MTWIDIHHESAVSGWIPHHGEEIASPAGPRRSSAAEARWRFLSIIHTASHRRCIDAESHLPESAAWQEMAVALRVAIRAARRRQIAFERPLRELHKIAAIWSFAGIEGKQEASLFLAHVSFAKLAALDLGYDKLGCNALDLLGKTDRRWMASAWGERPAHMTAKMLYHDLWIEERARMLGAYTVAPCDRSRKMRADG